MLSQAQAPRQFSLNAHLGECVTAVLGACTVNEFPAMLDLTDGKTHNLLCIGEADGNMELVVWRDLDPTLAYYKQAELLNNVHASLAGSSGAMPRSFNLDKISQEQQRLVKKLRRLQSESALEEQPDPVWCHLAPPEQPLWARKNVESWLASQPPPPMSADAASMFV